MEKIHISKAKSLAGNFKISYVILCMIFSILFIFTALDIPIPAYAYPVEDATTANGLGNMHYDSEKHKWVYDVSYGESGEDGIDIPEKIGNDVINGTKTTGSVAFIFFAHF